MSERVPARVLAAALLVLAVLLGACSGGSRPARQNPAGPPSPAAPSPTSAPPEQLTIAFTGDILAHEPVYERAAVDGRASHRSYDFRPMFARVKPLLATSDLAICHQETPLLPTDKGVTGYPTFNSPPEIADAIVDAGFQGCSTASNHSYDRGAAGVASTLANLDRVKVAHVGTARTPAERARPEVHVVRGTRIALLDYTYGLNGQALPADQAFHVNLIDVPTILRDANAARKGGAQIVVVQMHWGTENQAAPTAEQRSQARRLLASPDIDAIVGGHVHLVQPVEKIGRKYVVYGTGNFLSNQSAQCCPPASQDGVITTLHFARSGTGWMVSRISYTPTWVDRSGGYVILPVAQTLRKPGLSPAMRKALTDSWRRTTTVMSAAHAPNVVPDARP
jgi:poly-gamma-glutamate synthesis protein (capsule biosynthesis protein)